MPDERRDLALRAWAALLRTHAGVVSRVAGDLVATTKLPIQWYDMLLELEHAPERRLRMQDLGERVVLSRSRVSRIVDELVAANLVVRTADPNDGRVVHAAMTAAGRTRLRRAAPVYVNAVASRFGDQLTAGELETIADALGRLNSTVVA